MISSYLRTKIHPIFQNNHFTFITFLPKNLIDVAKINLEIEKILPMTTLMKNSASNREENCKHQNKLINFFK